MVDVRGRVGWTAPGWLAAIVTVLLLLTATRAGAQPAVSSGSASSGSASSTIVRLIGVGLVLTADGTLWQYRPDRSVWETIDESFRQQGKVTHVLPLPVTPESIREMVTFGFLLTDSGECWLYDINKDRWQKLSPPRATH